MAHFYFHIRDNGKLIRDEEGLELPDLGAAIERSEADASALLVDAMEEGENISHQVFEVTSDEGKIVHTRQLGYLDRR